MNAEDGPPLRPGGSARSEDFLRLARASGPPRHPRPCADKHLAPRLGPNGQIGGRVPGVIKRPEALLQSAGLGGTAEIDPPVAGEHFAEEPRLGGDRLGVARISGGAQNKPAPGPLLLPEPRRELAVVGEARRIQGCAGGKLGLEARLAPRKPTQEQRHAQRVAAKKAQCGFVEGVGPQERPVHIHRQRHVPAGVAAGVGTRARPGSCHAPAPRPTPLRAAARACRQGGLTPTRWCRGAWR